MVTQRYFFFPVFQADNTLATQLHNNFNGDPAKSEVIAAEMKSNPRFVSDGQFQS